MKLPPVVSQVKVDLGASTAQWTFAQWTRQLSSVTAPMARQMAKTAWIADTLISIQPVMTIVGRMRFLAGIALPLP